MSSLSSPIATYEGMVKMSDSLIAKTTQVRCPQCGGLSAYSPQNRSRPFCSERCKLLDLGAWATDQYAVPGAVIENPIGGTDDHALPSDGQVLQ